MTSEANAYSHFSVWHSNLTQHTQERHRIWMGASEQKKASRSLQEFPPTVFLLSHSGKESEKTKIPTACLSNMTSEDAAVISMVLHTMQCPAYVQCYQSMSNMDSQLLLSLKL